MENRSKNQERQAQRGVVVTSVDRSLADPTRIRIFDLLCRGPNTVSELAEQIGLSPDRLYYHLDLLEQGGLVRLRSTRPKRIYELASPLEEGTGQ